MQIRIKVLKSLSLYSRLSGGVGSPGKYQIEGENMVSVMDTCFADAQPMLRVSRASKLRRVWKVEWLICAITRNGIAWLPSGVIA